MQVPVLPCAAELTAPVLLIVFNRPKPAHRVFEAVRQARPARLYIAADGPRPNRPGDAANCTETRALIADGIDWPCEVHRLFHHENLGCGQGPAAAISWFFDHESEGIVLEDDCLPTLSFFQFCQEMLVRYRHDTRVMHIGGGNFSSEARQPALAGAESYYFSGRVHSWGWASWKRAWQYFDFYLALLPELRRRGALPGIYPSLLERTYWLRKFEAVRTGPQPAHIWDYQWHFTVAAHGGLTIVPTMNLITNIGFGDDATHTFDAHAQLLHPTAGELAFPLVHPPVTLRDWRRDRQYFREHLVRHAWATVRRLFTRMLPATLAAPVAPVPGPRTVSYTIPAMP